MTAVFDLFNNRSRIEVFTPYPQYFNPFNGGKHNVIKICIRHCHRSEDYIYVICWIPWPLQVAVRVHNRLQTEGVSFHWHGLLQRGTPWMDGVPMVSQCPILPGQVFQYRWDASIISVCFRSEYCTCIIHKSHQIVNILQYQRHSHRCVFGGWNVTAFFNDLCMLRPKYVKEMKHFFFKYTKKNQIHTIGMSCWFKKKLLWFFYREYATRFEHLLVCFQYTHLNLTSIKRNAFQTYCIITGDFDVIDLLLNISPKLFQCSK